MCVNKWQQQCTPTTEKLEKSKSSSVCVVENILEYHKMMTLDLEKEDWESENISSAPLYIFIRLFYDF